MAGGGGGGEEDVSRQTRAVTQWSAYRAGNPEKVATVGSTPAPGRDRAKGTCSVLPSQRVC